MRYACAEGSARYACTCTEGSCSARQLMSTSEVAAVFDPTVATSGVFSSQVCSPVCHCFYSYSHVLHESHASVDSKTCTGSSALAAYENSV